MTNSTSTSTEAPAQAGPPTRLLSGVVCMLLASFGYATMGALVKVACRDQSFFTVVFARSIVVIALVWPLLRWRNQSFRATNKKLLRWRNISGFAALSCYFYALSAIPLANAVTLQYTSPLFVALLSGVILGERVSLGDYTFICLAFAGAALIISPDLSRMDLDSLAALASAFLAGLAYLAVRGLRTTDSPETIVLHFALFSAVCSSPGLLLAERAPQGLEWLALAGVGLFATMGQIFMTWAYRLAPAAYISAFSYFTVLVSAAYGIGLFAEIPTAMSGVGAVLIVAAGVGMSLGRRGLVAAPRR